MIDRGSPAETATIAAVRRADASLQFAADVKSFSARLALEALPGAPLPAASFRLRLRSGRLWLKRGALGAVLVTTLSGSAVAMAQGAQPGASLYGVKRASESLWLAVSIGPQDRASRLLGLAERRAAEVGRAQRDGHPMLARQAAEDAQRDILAATGLGSSLSPQERGQLEQRAHAEDERVTTLLAPSTSSTGGQHGNGDGPAAPGASPGGVGEAPGGTHEGTSGGTTQSPSGGTHEGTSGGTTEPPSGASSQGASDGTSQTPSRGVTEAPSSSTLGASLDGG
ncbi:MAG: hypothetical protein NVSMB32_11800 [Actinomycetota bacterium]